MPQSQSNAPAKNYFLPPTAVSTSFSHFPFGGRMGGIHIINRGSTTIVFSFDGVNDHGQLFPADVAETRDNIDQSEIWIKSVGGAGQIQLEAWRRS